MTGKVTVVALAPRDSVRPVIRGARVRPGRVCAESAPGCRVTRAYLYVRMSERSTVVARIERAVRGRWKLTRTLDFDAAKGRDRHRIYVRGFDPGALPDQARGLRRRGQPLAREAGPVQDRKALLAGRAGVMDDFPLPGMGEAVVAVPAPGRGAGMVGGRAVRRARRRRAASCSATAFATATTGTTRRWSRARTTARPSPRSRPSTRRTSARWGWSARRSPAPTPAAGASTCAARRRTARTGGSTCSSPTSWRGSGAPSRGRRSPATSASG